MFSGVSWTRWLLVAAIVPMSACAGGDEPSVLGPEDGAVAESVVPEEVAAEEVVPGASSSTVPPVTTVEPSGTEAPSTTAAVGDATTTTIEAEAVPSLEDVPFEVRGDFVFPDDPELPVVVDAAAAFIAAANAAAANPSDESLRQALFAVTDDALGRGFERYLNDLVANGERVVRQPETRFVVLAPTAETYGPSATFEMCVVDADLRVRTGAGPNGADLIVDDVLASGIQTYQFVQVDGRWVVSDFETTIREEGRSLCA
jgi:hypothetical protein